ncbi:hypothetical protein BDB00DRAFT_357918 [Zychaea mexicana]|uniref:uncharacterized protein n=1 Tax=Zychaea mexicana TaxID=64656 RepID=UPI0022FF2ECB|nr:uncharacterized protein BDB00DRAFT_357918 [Zychaea mexicana]KAI9493834.1 hypothetical protein BDB00DRAFT_357918 [Zychaea mexicana]
MNVSLIPPTRTTHCDRRKTLSTSPLKKQRMNPTTMCHAITKDLDTTAGLAQRLVHVTTHMHQDTEPSNKKEEQDDCLLALARQIGLCKRSLRFSEKAFVDIWLDQLLVSTTTLSSPLLVYHALARDTCLTLGTLIVGAELHWLTDQCQHLICMVPPSLAAYRDYVEAMIVESRWDAIHALIDEEMETMRSVWSSSLANDKKAYAKRCHHMEQFFVIMHDPQRLKMFSQDERRSMVKTHVLNRLFAPDPEMDGMKAKQLPVEDERTLLIHGPVLRHLTEWIHPSTLLLPETASTTKMFV